MNLHSPEKFNKINESEENLDLEKTLISILKNKLDIKILSKKDDDYIEIISESEDFVSIK